MTDHINDWIVIPQLLEHPLKKATSYFPHYQLHNTILTQTKLSCSHGTGPEQGNDTWPFCEQMNTYISFLKYQAAPYKLDSLSAKLTVLPIIIMKIVWQP